MEFKIATLLEERRGREDCEDARVIAGKIRECHYTGLCTSKIPFGYGYLCGQGIVNLSGEQSEVALDAAVKNDRRL